MNQHPNAWPDSPPARRGYVDFEPWELTHQQRQHDSERKASQQWHAQHGTEGCADTSDEPGQWPEGGFIALLLVVACVVAALVLAGLLGGAV